MSGVGTGSLNITGPDLPMEERETGDQLRARMEAKVKRSHSPWANRPAPPKHEGRAYPVVAEVVERFVEPAPVAPVPAAQPKPAPRPPAPRPAAAVPTERTVRPAPDAAGIVQDYLDGQAVYAIAAARSHSTATVYRILRTTPGVTLRDDRATNSGSKKKTHDPAVVDAVRRLYLDEQLSQSEVADRLGLSVKVVFTIMARHDIPGRPGQSGAKPGLSTLATLKVDIAAAGLTVAGLRTWATKHGVTVGQVGIPSRTVLDAYLAHSVGSAVDPRPAPAPVTPEPVPVTLEEAPVTRSVHLPTFAEIMDELADVTLHLVDGTLAELRASHPPIGGTDGHPVTVAALTDAGTDDRRRCERCYDLVHTLSSHDECDECVADLAALHRRRPPSVEDATLTYTQALAASIAAQDALTAAHTDLRAAIRADH